MKYRHYSPRAELWLYPPAAAGWTALPPCQRLLEDVVRLRAGGSRVAVLARERVDADHFIALPSEARELGHRLFGWLRELDDLGMDYVLIEGIHALGVGRAVMDRLTRAASRVLGTERDMESTHGGLA
jgi:L-threonylcarbamoyladenylate synthase